MKSIQVVYANQNRWQEALDSFVRVLKFGGVPVEDRKYCYSWLSELYEKKKDYQHALEAYRKEWNLEKDESGLLLEIARNECLLHQPNIV